MLPRKNYNNAYEKHDIQLLSSDVHFKLASTNDLKLSNRAEKHIY